MRPNLLLATLAVSLLAATAAFAAAPVESKTSFVLGPQTGKFAGAVTADDPKCVSGRKVFVYRIAPGPKERVAKDFSDINGLWKRQTEEQSGTWFAKLKPERRGGLYCKGDKSPQRSAG
jgi:hypothetical protein